MYDYQNDAYLEDEEEIDLKDLINNALFNNLKKIIIVTIIGGSLGLGFSYFKNYRENKIVEALITDKEAALEKYEDDVSETDLLEVNNYEVNKEIYETQVDYFNNSIVFGLTNVGKLYRFEANFRVKNVKDIDGVISVINSEMFTDEYLNEIGQELGVTNNSEYYDLNTFVRELISVSNKSGNSSGLLAETMDKTISVSFFYDNEELVQKIGKELASKIVSMNSEIYAESGSTLYLLSQNTTVTSYSWINDSINSYENNIKTLSESLETALKDFDKIQLKYYASLHPEEEIKIGKGRVKYTAIGLAAGFVIICGLYVMTYLLSDKLHTTDELEYLGFKVYGLTGKRHKELLKNANVVEADVINKLISLDLKNNGSEEVIIASTLGLKDIEDTVSNIRKDIKVTDVYDDMFNNLDFINKCKEDIEIILVEKRNVTKKSDMYRLRQMIKDYKLNVLGSVIDNG